MKASYNRGDWGPRNKVLSDLSKRSSPFTFINYSNDLSGSFTYLSTYRQLCKGWRTRVQSVFWSLAEFCHNKIVQSSHENYFNVCRQHKEK